MTDVIVIGGGVAGLSTGIYCLKNGLTCTLVEKNPTCGGNLTGWTRGQCYIDNCTHWLTGTLPSSSLFKIWRDIGIISDIGSLYQGEIFYETEYCGERIAFLRYPEKTRANMLLCSPEDKKEIDRFIDAVEAVMDHMTDGKYTAALAIACARYRYISLKELSERFNSKLLKTAFTDYLCKDFSAVFLIWSYAAFASGNGMIPRGGSKKAADRVVDKFKTLGGELRCQCRAMNIAIENKTAFGVTLDNGEFISSRAVVCACDPYITFNQLLPNGYTPRRYSFFQKRSELFSSVQAAFVCDRAENSSFGTRIIDINMELLSGNRRTIVREYSYEPEFAPYGKIVLQTMTYQDKAESKAWIDLAEDKIKYEAVKQKYIEKQLFALKRAFPEFAASLECIDIWTPATYNRYFGAKYGSYMGYMLTPQTPMHNLGKSIRGLKNVFLATQWEYAPGGLPTAARAGKKTAEKLATILK